MFCGKYAFNFFKKTFFLKACLGFLLLAYGCATPSPDDPVSSDDLSEKLAKAIATPDLPATQSSPGAAPTIDALQTAPQANEPQTTILPGTGAFVNPQPAEPIPPGSTSRDGEVTLNFEAAAIGEVVKVIFDILEENYIIDPRVRGEVTVQTGRPLPKELLIPTLENLLRMNNAALVYSDGLYKIIPATGALTGNAAPELDTASLTPGYGVRVIPLRYIGAQEMAKILEPLLPRGGVLYVDTGRNLLMLGGTSRELNIAQQTVDVFDVNWLKGMSIGMYRLQNVDSGTMVADLSNLFGEGADLPGAGLFRFLPISQINAILVITPQAEYLEDIGAWIERLDRVGGERLYVYEVQNGNAEYLASVLAEVFGAQGGQPVSTTAGRVAPGLEPAQLTSPRDSDQDPVDRDEPAETERSSGLRRGNEQESRAQRPDEDSDIRAQQATLGAPPISRGAGSASAVSGMEGVRIIPDVENNTLLIWASNFTYEKILDALRKLDITPRQVLVEVTIAEVTLGGDLQYGLQWFFKNNVAGDYGGRGVLGQEGTGGITGTIGGASSFAYSISKNGVVRLLLEALAEESKVKILSSPQIMVIDNQEAEIRVGTDQPVRSSTTTTDGGNITESIEFRQTGVVLTVSPQVNAGGLITMEIAQEVTDVGEIDAATGQRSFLTREVQSRVAVQSGESIVLGGLISETRRSTQGGIPVLYKVPVIGPLFGRTSDETNRTELLVLITPQVARDNREALQVTDELKQRMRTVVPFVEEHLEKKPLIIEPSRP